MMIIGCDLHTGQFYRWTESPARSFPLSRRPLAFNLHRPGAARRVLAKAAPLPILRAHTTRASPDSDECIAAFPQTDAHRGR